MSTALKHAGLPPRDPFQPGGLLSLGKPGLIDDLFREAGFREIATTKIAAPFRLPTVRDYIDVHPNIGGADRADRAAPRTGKGRSGLGRYREGV